MTPEDRKFRMNHLRMAANRLREQAARLEEEAACFDAEADKIEMRQDQTPADDGKRKPEILGGMDW